MSRRVWLPIATQIAAVFFICNSAQSGFADEMFDETVAPFLKKHCLACHGEAKQEALVRFDSVSEFRAKDRNLWTSVHERISSGEMPPEGRPRPAKKEQAAVLNWIVNEQRQLAVGRTRRLNRRELSAALQDVTGLSVDYAFGLPGDGKIAGFDTGAEGLQDAASSVEQFMVVSRRAVDAIRFLEPASGKVFSADLRDTKDPRKVLDPWKAEGANPKTRGLAVPGIGLLLEPKWVGEKGGSTLVMPAPENDHGVLRLALTVAQKKYFDGLPNPHLWVKVGGRVIDRREITASADKPVELVYEVQLDDLAIEPKGVTIEISGRVELPYAVKGFENEDRTKPENRIPGGPGLFRPKYNRKSKKPEEIPVPFVVLKSIQVEPNFVAAWPRDGSLGELTDDEATAERLLSEWMSRAWRRPVSDSESSRFLALYRQLRNQQLAFDPALRATFQSVLLSGPFRYLESPREVEAAKARIPGLDQHAIASRLSFMLIGSPPDAELRRLAAEGKLRDAKVIDAQVDRLLEDPRSDNFVRPFVNQWLVMDQPITLTMDYFEKQDFRFGRFLKESMKNETVHYLSELLKRNRPARELISSDWTMMNNSLAWHYGYEGIDEGSLRRVPLKKNDPRGGGVLSHAGIQSMLCWMGDNWVIYRGAWTLRHILDDPPPPPPLEVPELDPSAGSNKGKSFRELLKQHQQDERCSICHRKMDALGFAFQNFDISGRWRDKEFASYARRELDGKIEWRGTGKSRPVDAAGRLPRGEQFKTFAECKELIVKNYLDDVVRGLAKKFVLYGTGRLPDVDDMAVIRSIMTEHASRGYPLKDVLKGLIRSRVFLEN